MITKITPIQELKQIFLEIFLNKTDKVTDVSQESVLNGLAYGCAKIGQKCLVNQSVVEGHIFPDTAYGVYLDNLAAIRGVSPRFGASASSTYIRITADPGTYYQQAVHYFSSTSGLNFELEDDVVIPISGYTYAKVHCTSTGANTNVDPLTINKINTAPTGHIACTNEYRAMGGRDNEDDALFRQRIKDSINHLSRNTIAYLEQVFMSINSNVLRIHKGSVDLDGRLNLIVVSVNGADFTQQEFDEILSRSEEYLSLADLLKNGTNFVLKLNNVDWLPIDVDFRVDIDSAYNVDSVRRDIQIQMNKLFDYRFWKYGDKVEWENMLYVVQNVEGIRYCPDNYFLPKSDINVPKFRLPRIRSFIMRDLNGNVIFDNNGVLNDVYYPNEIDGSYINTVLFS